MSFLTPLFWLGLVATAVPIIVHLVRRTRAPRVGFPSLMFVRRVPQETIRRRRLQNLLLLILRCLALLLLVLAFVRPFLRTRGFGRGTTNGVEIILIDRSFSMRYENRFEQALARAKELVNERQREQIGLVLFDEGFEVVVPPTADHTRLRSELVKLTAGFGATDLDQALRGAESLLDRLPPGERVIHLLSDFQSTSRKTGDTAYRASSGVRINLVKIGRPAAVNIATSEVIGTATIHQPKYIDPLTARVANYGPGKLDRVLVELRLNDRTVEKREISIPERDTQTIEFSGFNLNEGQNQASILLKGDSFESDNRYDFILRRQARSKALALGSLVGGASKSESLYLTNALAAGENSPLELVVRSPNQVSSADIQEQRLIFVNDVNLPVGLAEVLIKQVEAGAGLIVAVGPRTESVAFNKIFSSRLGLSLWGKVDRPGEGVTLGEVSAAHPIFEPFRRTGRLPTAQIRTYREIKELAGAVVLASYDDGAPALLESKMGRGRALLLTTTLDLTWNDLALTPFYLPLLRQMAHHLLGAEPPLAERVGGAVLVEATPEGSLPPIDSPSGKRLPSPKSEIGGSVITATETGFYRLRYPDRTNLFAVNIAARESDLTGLDTNQLLAELTSRSVDNAEMGPSGSAAQTESEGPAELEARQRIWFYLLIAALLLFITEGFIARRLRASKLIN